MKIKVTILGRIPRDEWDKSTHERGGKTFDVDDSAKGRIKRLSASDVLDIDRIWLKDYDGFLLATELPSPVPVFMSKKEMSTMTECAILHLRSGIIVVKETKTKIERMLKI